MSDLTMLRILFGYIAVVLIAKFLTEWKLGGR